MYNSRGYKLLLKWILSKKRCSCTFKQFLHYCSLQTNAANTYSSKPNTHLWKNWKKYLRGIWFQSFNFLFGATFFFLLLNIVEAFVCQFLNSSDICLACLPLTFWLIGNTVSQIFYSHFRKVAFLIPQYKLIHLCHKDFFYM